MPYPGYTTEEIARRGRDLYERRLRAEVEPEHGGRFVVVDITTDDYEVADDDLEASDRMVDRNPGAILYGTRIGERAAYRIGASEWRSMTKVEKLAREVQKLNRTELAAFREWFREYDSIDWDRQIEEDVRAGKLDKLAEEALAAHKAGETKEI